MVERTLNENFEVFLARLMERLKQELENEPDDAFALRRAMLGLMIVTPDSDRRSAKRFVTYLLEQFPPLADAFEDEMHGLLDAFSVRRHRDGEHAEIQFQSALVDDVMEEELSTSDLTLAGLRWPWERTARRYVAFFDIMGFKAMLDRHRGDPDAVYEIMDLLREAAASSEEFDYDAKSAIDPLNFSGCWLRFAQFSDSIVLITRDDSRKSSAMIALAAQLMFIRAMNIGIPIRGAIARGEFTADFDKSIFFGQPLVDAYLLEERQAWYGACYHSSCEHDPDHPQTDTLPTAPKDWLPMHAMYQVPVKDGVGHEELNAVNWAMIFHKDPAKLDAAIEHMRNDDHPKLKAYYEETRRFGHAMLNMMMEETQG